MATELTERIAEPATRFPKIDGAHITPTVPPKREIPVVPSEFTPGMAGAPGATQIVALEGGPFDGHEARVPRDVDSKLLPTLRPGGPRPQTDEEKAARIFPGEYVNATYVRSGRRDDEGRAVFEFLGIE
jgi:hypothetical protein